MSLSKPDDLKSLGSGGADFDKIDRVADASLLEAFPNPMKTNENARYNVQLGGYDDQKEFTSLCPKTGQPDFARIIVVYAPDKLCVESKSWKLYLGSYRSAREFHEACVAQIGAHLVDLLEPYYLKVVGEFTPRGGISINPVWEYNRPNPMMLWNSEDGLQQTEVIPDPVN